MFAALSPVSSAASAPGGAVRSEGPSSSGSSALEPAASVRARDTGPARASAPVATLRAEAVAALQSGEGPASARRDERNPEAPGRSALASASSGNLALAGDEAKSKKPSAGGEEELTEEQEKQVRDLKKRDAEVKQHEQAHASVGGPYAGSPSYQYTRGPDGKRYAVSGEVPIDASPEREPEQTIRKMEIVIRAALAPSEPSPQDRQVAAQARQQRSEAQADLQKLRAAERDGENGGAATGLSAKPASQRAEDAEEDRAAQARQQATAAVAAYQAAEAAAAALFGSGPAPQSIVA